MSTKNLARTVIEGGRTHYSQAERKQTIRSRRAYERMYLSRAARDPEAAWSTDPRRPGAVGPGFSDKLGPARRWLTAHIGERWDAVYAELRRRFDLRTIPGRHIVVDHMLTWVRRGPEFRRWGRWDFIVDDEGILRAGERSRRRPKSTWRERARLERWLGASRVGRRGNVWFWFERIHRDAPPAANAPVHYRQGHRLSPEDAAAWEAYPEAARRDFTIAV